MSNYKFSEKRIINFLFNNDNNSIDKNKIKEILYEATNEELDTIISELVKENILVNVNGFYKLPLEETSENMDKNKKETVNVPNDKNKKLIEMLKRQKDLKLRFNEDFYALSEIKKEYFKKYPDLTDEDFQIDLNATQYKINGNFIILKKYKDTEDYIKAKILKEDILDSETFKSSLPENFVGPVTFNRIINELQNDYSIIEFEKNNFINIRKINEMGFYISDFKKYCDDVLNFMDGKCFTIKYLKSLNFDSKLYMLGFDDLFYESILKQDIRFYSQKNSLCVVFSTICRPTLENTAKDILRYKKIIDVKEFKEIITKYFGFCVDDRGKTSYGFDLQGNNDEGMYYSVELEKIFLDKNDFYAEVNDYNDIV